MNRFGYVRRKPVRRRVFDSAGTGNLYSSWLTTNYSADSELKTTLRTIRARSRQLANNNDYAKKFIRMVKTNVIGHKGIILQGDVKNEDGKPDKIANDRIEQAWQRWSKRGNCDVTGKYSFRDIQNIVVTSVARDGEILIRKILGYDNPFGFALQLLEADHLDENYNVTLDNGNQVKMGVEYDNWNRAVAYWIFPQHPGDVYFPYVYRYNDRVRIPAEEMLHIFLDARISQSRGIPWMHAAMTRLNMIGAYEEAEIVAARIGAVKGGFYTKKEDSAAEYTGDDIDSDGNFIEEPEPGTYYQLPIGYDFKPNDPTHPTTAYKDFIKSILRGIASGLDVSYNYLANDLEGVNYSSIRAGVLDERDVWREIQSWNVEHFHQPIFDEWLRLALLTQQISLPISKYAKFDNVKWQPRGWAWVDPDKDVKAQQAAIKSGLKTATAAVAETGQNYEDTIRKLKEEKELRESIGYDVDYDAELTVGEDDPQEIN